MALKRRGRAVSIQMAPFTRALIAEPPQQPRTLANKNEGGAVGALAVQHGGTVHGGGAREEWRELWC